MYTICETVILFMKTCHKRIALICYIFKWKNRLFYDTAFWLDDERKTGKAVGLFWLEKAWHDELFIAAWKWQWIRWREPTRTVRLTNRLIIWIVAMKSMHFQTGHLKARSWLVTCRRRWKRRTGIWGRSKKDELTPSSLLIHAKTWEVASNDLFHICEGAGRRTIIKLHLLAIFPCNCFRQIHNSLRDHLIVDGPKERCTYLKIEWKMTTTSGWIVRWRSRHDRW